MDNGRKIRVMWHPDDYFKLQCDVVVAIAVVVVANERSSEFGLLLSSRKQHERVQG